MLVQSRRQVSLKLVSLLYVLDRLMRQSLGKQCRGDFRWSLSRLAWRSIVNRSALSFALVTSCFFCSTFVTGMLAFDTARAWFACWSPTSCSSALLSEFVSLPSSERGRHPAALVVTMLCLGCPPPASLGSFRPSFHHSCNFWPVCRAP